MMTSPSKTYLKVPVANGASVAATTRKAKCSSESSSHTERMINGSKNKKTVNKESSLLPRYPDMATPEPPMEENERSISPVVEELTRIKERVFEVPPLLTHSL